MNRERNSQSIIPMIGSLKRVQRVLNSRRASLLIILFAILSFAAYGQTPNINLKRCAQDGLGFDYAASDCQEANCSPQCGLGEPRNSYSHLATAARTETPKFLYRLMITNEGAKVIHSVEWEYVFTDPETRAEVARHAFYTQQRVRPNESKTLIEYSTSPPTKVISVKALARPEPDRFIEKVILTRIMYEDGSVWMLQPSPR